MMGRPPRSTLLPCTTLFRSLLATGPGEIRLCCGENCAEDPDDAADLAGPTSEVDQDDADHARHDGSVHQVLDRKSTRLNSSHDQISDADFCLRDSAILALWNSLVCR